MKQLLRQLSNRTPRSRVATRVLLGQDVLAYELVVRLMQLEGGDDCLEKLARLWAVCLMLYREGPAMLVRWHL